MGALERVQPRAKSPRSGDSPMAAINAVMSEEEEVQVQPAPAGAANAAAAAAGETDRQINLRKAIVEIQADRELDSTEKSRRIQALMCSGSPLCSPSRTQVAEVEAGEENEEASDEFTVTYHDESAAVLGCAHYPRQAKIRAPCCGKFYTCRLCH